MAPAERMSLEMLPNFDLRIGGLSVVRQHWVKLDTGYDCLVMDTRTGQQFPGNVLDLVLMGGALESFLERRNLAGGLDACT